MMEPVYFLLHMIVPVYFSHDGASAFNISPDVPPVSNEGAAALDEPGISRIGFTRKRTA